MAFGGVGGRNEVVRCGQVRVDVVVDECGVFVWSGDAGDVPLAVATEVAQ